MFRDYFKFQLLYHWCMWRTVLSWVKKGCCFKFLLIICIWPSHPVSSKANVMLEYDIDEAQALLEKNLSTASRNLETLEDDLDFLRDQFTTTEVSILWITSVHSEFTSEVMGFIVAGVILGHVLMAHLLAGQRKVSVAFMVKMFHGFGVINKWWHLLAWSLIFSLWP